MKKTTLIFLFVTVALDVTGMGIIIPLMPDLIKLLSGEGVADAARYSGYMELIYAGAGFLFAPLLGELSDRWGRKPVLLLALIGLGVNYLFHAWATSVEWLFVSRFLAGVCGASFVVAYAFIADLSKPEDKSKYFGIIGAAFGVGYIVGPALGGFFAQWDLRTPFYVAAILSFANVLLGYFFIRESLAKKDRRQMQLSKCNPFSALRFLASYRSLFFIVAAYFLIQLANLSVHATLTFFAKAQFDWSATVIGISLAYVGVLVTIAHVVLISFSERTLGTRWTLFAGAGLCILGLVLFGTTHIGWLLYLYSIPYCVGIIIIPILQRILSAQVATSLQGKMQGALASVMNVANITGPLLWTQIFYFSTKDPAGFYSPGLVFYIAAFVMGGALVLMLRHIQEVVYD